MPNVLLAVMVAVTGLGVTLQPAGDAGAASTSVLHALTPCRLLDTREPAVPVPGPGSTTHVQVGGVCGVPDEAIAAAITVTAASAHSDGYVTVWPHGQNRPLASVLNHAAGDTVANGGLFQLGAGGVVEVYSSAGTHLIVDVAAYFVAAGESAAGRFVPVPHRRLVDTRETGRPSPGTAVTVGSSSIPADAVAVAINVTTTGVRSPGWFTAFATGQPPPVASILTVDRVGQTRGAAAIAPVVGGAFDVYTSGGDHVIVDITGYFTGPSAPVSSDGLFIPTRPTRVFDTRRADGPSGGPRVYSGGAREVPLGATGSPVAAVAANVTVTETASAGWWMLGPAGVPDGGVSTVNTDRARQAIANSAVTAVSNRGLVIHGSVSSDVVVDITGHFTGEPAVATLPVPPNELPRRRVTIIGDSAMAGVRWNGAYGGLRGFDAVPLLESCRRLVYPSCNGREGYNPLTAMNHILRLPAPAPDDILVVAVGYNDWDSRFSRDFDSVISAARRTGFEHIVWVSYREDNSYRLPGNVPTRYADYGVMNQIVRDKLASGAFPDVEIWDLDRYTLGISGWFYADGVHQRRLGSWGVADWLSRHVAALDGIPCPVPWRPGWRIEDPCPNPDSLAAVLGHPSIDQLYPV